MKISKSAVGFTFFCCFGTNLVTTPRLRYLRTKIGAYPALLQFQAGPE